MLAPRISLRKPISHGVMADVAAERFGRVPISLDRPLEADPQRRSEIDYEAFAQLVAELSGALWSLGVRPWDRVAVWKRSNYDTLALAAAAARIGAVPALLWGHLDVGVVPILLERLDRPFLVIDRETAKPLSSHLLETLSRRVIGVDGGDVRLHDGLGAPIPPPQPRSADEQGAITHTSGTTGMPKLVQQSVRSISNAGRMEAWRWPFAGHEPGGTVGVCVSYVHIRALMGYTAALACGSRIVALADGADLATVERMLDKHEPTRIDATPNTLLAWEPLCESPARPFRRVRTFFSTFDAAHPRTIRSLLRASERRFPVYVENYGQSETGGVTARVHARAGLGVRVAQASSRDVGRVIPLMTRFRVVDPDSGRRVPRGTVGSIEVRTPAIGMTYIGQPDEWRRKQRGRWFATGDVGVHTRRDTLQLLDREVDQIPGVPSCLWLEDVLLDRLPELSEVVLVPDGADRPTVVVATADGAPLAAARWRSAIADLPPLRGPVRLDESELPRTGTAKVRRQVLVERLKREPGSRGLPTEAVV